jgi:hypothetical protein
MACECFFRALRIHPRTRAEAKDGGGAAARRGRDWGDPTTTQYVLRWRFSYGQRRDEYRSSPRSPGRELAAGVRLCFLKRLCIFSVDATACTPPSRPQPHACSGHGLSQSLSLLTEHVSFTRTLDQIDALLVRRVRQPARAETRRGRDRRSHTVPRPSSTRQKAPTQPLLPAARRS